MVVDVVGFFDKEVGTCTLYVFSSKIDKFIGSPHNLYIKLYIEGLATRSSTLVLRISTFCT